MPATPHTEDGMRIEPPVSEPRAPRQASAASAAAEPPLEPPGMWSRFHGLQVGLLTTPYANSWVTVLPTTTAPAARSRSTAAASRLGTRSAWTLELEVVR